jgi:hypothetical protein
MYLDQLDQLLGHLTEAEGAMSANLVELDGHPTTKLLQSAGLTGTTAERALPAVKALEDLWTQYTALHQILQQARGVRGNGHRLDAAETARFEQLLCGQSIVLTGAQVPLAQRGLLGQTETTWQVSPGQLVQAMTITFDQARDVIFTVDRLWRDLVPRLDQLRRQLTELKGQAAPLGVAEQVGLPQLEAQVNRLGARVISDPMAAGDELTASVDPSLATCRSTLADLTARHASLQPDLARARTQLDEIVRLRDEGAGALVEARRKIARPQGLLEAIGTAALLDGRQGLAPWLHRLVDIVGQGNWQAGRRGLDQWLDNARRTRDAALTVRDANRAPVRQRDELRGRLAAYRAKAAALGLGEQAELEELYAAAHEALYTAPTDLDRAGDLLARYSGSLQGPPSRAADTGGAR